MLTCTIIVAISGPVCGTIADTKGFKKPLFMASIIIGTIGCALLGLMVQWMACLVLVLGSGKIGISMETAMGIAFVIVALWWLGMSVPLLKKYEQRYYVEKQPRAIAQSFKRLGSTFKNIKKEKQVFIMDICGKGASFVGTTIVSVVSQLTGNISIGVAMIAILFCVGIAIFFKAVSMSKSYEKPADIMYSVNVGKSVL